MELKDTICALSSAPGMGAIALIRLSGDRALSIARKCSPKLPQAELTPRRAYFTSFYHQKEWLDEVVLTYFKGPASYSGEDVVEIACHGSTYIQQNILSALLAAGCRMAEPGEFTLRAFFNGKMDLSQAEAVADLIASESKASHQLAQQQMRGAYSDQIRALRSELIDFASLIELELDFGEEDVEFADRSKLDALLNKLQGVIAELIGSYKLGKVLKNGVPVAIVGAPNVGKSTLLNALAKEERAIVTEVAGTTRDAIEDVIQLEGIQFRFIDTAGIRETEDVVERIGIQRTFEKIEQASIVLYLFDIQIFQEKPELIREELALLRQKTADKRLILLANKTDLRDSVSLPPTLEGVRLLPLSAKTAAGLDQLQSFLLEEVNLNALSGQQSIVSNSRHMAELESAAQDLERVQAGLENGVSGDFLAMDIREAFKHLGSIIGEVDHDRDILGNIFGKFCIGK